jgi:hypothetical protein
MKLDYVKMFALAMFCLEFTIRNRNNGECWSVRFTLRHILLQFEGDYCESKRFSRFNLSLCKELSLALIGAICCLSTEACPDVLIDGT